MKRNTLVPCRMKGGNRRGSALLIVLGMLAFMVVSAVAFSAYMRYSRLPSSYLRRTSASRHLAKAALAEAINEIDFAICDNPHPGVGDAYVLKDSEGQYRTRSANFWKHRVFIGTNVMQSVFYPDPGTGFEETVPVLTVEGLGYIPPPLVNEARYFGRLSPAAHWKSFDFDAGRYAFCALDVSDYFDINHLFAGYPRSSSPNRRLSLAYLFENASHASAGSDGKSWDDWMAQFRKVDDEENPSRFSWSNTMVPLVSMADFGLAFGSKTLGSLKSPFYNYISGGGNNGFYDASGVSELKALKSMAFVTDGWFPAEAVPEGESDDERDIDLTNLENQPFLVSDLEQDKAKPPLYTIFDYSKSAQDVRDRLFESICGLGLCALYDYLDVDSLPLSLAIPTTERVPMVCGLQAKLGDGNFKIAKSQDPDSYTVTVPDRERTAKRTVKYTIDPTEFTQSLMGGSLKALVASPFHHADGIEDESFQLDGRFAFFLSSADMSLRTGNLDDVLHFKNFKDSSQPGLNSATGVLMTPFLKDSKLSKNAKTKMNDQKDALELVSFPLSEFAQVAASAFSGNPLLSVTYEWKQTYSLGGWSPKDPKAEDLTAATCGMPPLSATGTTDGTYANPALLLGKLKGDPASGPTLRLNAAIWLRVKNKDGDTVDLVPACIQDDDDLNGCNNYAMMGPIGNEIAGQAYPLLRFDFTDVKDKAFVLSIEGLESAAKAGTVAQVKPSFQTILCADPRYNHAPEDWFSVSDELTEENWLTACKAAERDGDIFMSVSDQGYLQSIYELAFLPRLTGALETANSNKQRGEYASPGDGRTSIREGFDTTVHKDLMWRTYRPFANSDGAADGFYKTGFTSAGTGPKVNPYSDSVEVLMAAFANTPADWRVASTNNADLSEADFKSAKTFNEKYAWNQMEMGSGTKNTYMKNTYIRYDDLQTLAEDYIASLCQNRTDEPMETFTLNSHTGAQDWETAWEGIDWNARFEDIVQANPTHKIWNVDRKFLYGYWHDCFAARQQLFLIFVRAAPLMMGGGGQGSIPPQLGSRAVALVWRDPAKTPEATNLGDSGKRYIPHRTRLLFYRQLD